MRLIRQVMRAQMNGLVLGVLVQLALADIRILADGIYVAQGLQLLHGIALAQTPHGHPELQGVRKVTSSREVFSAQVADAASHAVDNGHRQICLQLKDRLCDLQDCCHPLAEGNWQWADRPLQARAVESIRGVVSEVKSAAPLAGPCELQHAWWSAVGGYNERQAGNCLFWLFEEPQTNHESRQNSSSSADTGSDASGYVQGPGEQSEEYAGSAVEHAGGMQHEEQGEQLKGRAHGHADGTGGLGASTESRTNSTHAAGPAAQPDQSGHVDRPQKQWRSWTEKEVTNTL
ncbi:hypothetical protein ABBQ32_005106 [Trebouxia sp. C0010 RCD-2024]